MSPPQEDPELGPPQEDPELGPGDEPELLEPAEIPGNAPVPPFIASQGPIDPYAGLEARGRHKLTPQRVDRILTLVSVGNYVSTAVGAAGLNRTSYHRYMARAHKFEQQLIDHYGHDYDLHELAAGDNPWPNYVTDLTWSAWKLRYRLQSAADEAEAFVVTKIRSAIEQGDLRAQTWWLERARRDTWGRDRSAATDDAADERDQVDATTEEASALVHQALKAAAKGELPPGR